MFKKVVHMFLFLCLLALYGGMHRGANSYFNWM